MKSFIRLTHWLGCFLFAVVFFRPVAALATPSIPAQVATLSSTLMTGSAAQLNGFVTPMNVTRYWFQWGPITTNASTVTNYASITAPKTLVAGTQVIYVTNAISGLTAGMQYHYRLVASNSVGMVYGAEQRFGTGLVTAWGAGLTNNPDDYINYGQSIVPSGLSNMVKVACGFFHSMALRSNGRVVAWGDNDDGETDVPAGLSNVVAMAAGQLHSLALRSDGTVAAWGDNSVGETNVPSDLSNVVAVAAGVVHSLALRNDGTVVAWGAGLTNDPGNGDDYGQSIIPPGLSNVVAVAGGYTHSLALRSDGTVMAWGDNRYGQTNVPGGLSNVVAVAAGFIHSLALRNDGTVVAWGDNFYGETSVPVGLSNVIAVVAGGPYSAALRRDGTLIVWGDNTYDQTNVPVGLSNIVAVAGGGYHILALTVPFSTTMTLATSPNPTVYNQPLTLTAMVHPVGASGPVIFYDGATAIGTNSLDTNSIATLGISNASPGNHYFKAAYAGMGSYLGSASMILTQAVSRANTSITIASAPPVSAYGQPVVFTATVNPQFSGTPSGTVIFSASTFTITNTLVNGQSTITNASLPAGVNNLTVNYLGDGNFNGSNWTTNQLVLQAGTTNTLISSVNPSVSGQSVTFTATLNAVAPGAGMPTGIVAFYDGAVNLGSNSLNNGVATYTTGSLSTTNHNITAVYLGDVNFAGSTSLVLTQALKRAGSRMFSVMMPSFSVYGQPVVFNAYVSAVSPGMGTPTGIVTFFAGTNNLGSGTLTNGLASITNATVPVGMNNLKLSYLGDANFTNSTLMTNQMVAKASTTNALTSSVNPSVSGQTARFTVTVGAVAPGAGIPTGNVTFYDGATSLGTNLLVNGMAVLMMSNLTATVHNLTATYAGDTNFTGNTSLVLTQTVNKANTRVGSSFTPPVSVYGQPVALRAFIGVISPGTGMPTGTVTFFAGTNNLGSGTLTNGSASITNSTLPVGVDNITMNYLGDTNFNGSTWTTNQIVNRASTTNALASSLNPTSWGQTTRFTATVSALTPSMGMPTGSVTFYDGATSLGSKNLVNGAAVLMTSNLTTATHAITATYAGDTGFTGSTSLILTQTVNRAGSRITASSFTPPLSVYGQPVVMEAFVNAATPGISTPTGTVTFYYGTTNLGSAALITGSAWVGGLARITNAALPVGVDHITMNYSGDINFTNSTWTTNQIVNQAATTNQVASSVNPAVAGQPVTFTATISAVAPGAGVPTGSVIFYDGVTSLGGGTLTNGVATLTTSSLNTASHNITAAYLGDTNFKTSVSLVLTQVVDQAPTTNLLVSVLNPTVFGQAAIWTVTLNAVAPGAGVPTGTVTFFAGTNSFATNILVNGQASVTNATLLMGTNEITAVYAGDTNFLGSSACTNQVVNAAATTNELVSSVNPAVSGQAVTFTATLGTVAPGAGVPTGNVVFFAGANSLGTNSLVNGVASVTNSALAVGTNFITAVYTGDTNFLTSTSPVLTQAVISLTNSQVLAPAVVDKTSPKFRQTGLMQQSITVSNVTSTPYSAVRITLQLNPLQKQSGILVYNATGTNSNGDAYLESDFPVPPHGNVTFTVEYFVPDRTTIPTPAITVDLVAPAPPVAIPAGTPQAVTQNVLLPDNTFLVGFQTVKNASYYVLYSTNLLDWTVIPPAITGTGSAVQWLDQGPPQTPSAPGTGGNRFYRVIKAN